MPLITTAIGAGTAIYGAGKALGWWGQPPKQRYKKSPGEIAYEKELSRRAREGMYTKGAQFGMLSRATQVVSSAEQAQRLAQKGQALFGGTRGVASREQAKVGQESMYRALVEAGLSISEANELSKIKAQDVLGERATTESERANLLRMRGEQAGYQARQAGVGQFFGGLGNIAGDLDKLFGFASPELAKSIQGVLGKAPGDLQQSEIGFLRASRLQASDPEVWEGMMMQYDPDNILKLY